MAVSMFRKNKSAFTTLDGERNYYRNQRIIGKIKNMLGISSLIFLGYITAQYIDRPNIISRHLPFQEQISQTNSSSQTLQKNNNYNNLSNNTNSNNRLDELLNENIDLINYRGSPVSTHNFDYNNDKLEDILTLYEKDVAKVELKNNEGKTTNTLYLSTNDLYNMFLKHNDKNYNGTLPQNTAKQIYEISINLGVFTCNDKKNYSKLLQDAKITQICK